MEGPYGRLDQLLPAKVTHGSPAVALSPARGYQGWLEHVVSQQLKYKRCQLLWRLLVLLEKTVQTHLYHTV